MKLLINGLVKFVSGIIIIGALVFLPAGTLDFINGWIFSGVLFVPVLIMGVVLYVKAPELLKKRLEPKEKEGTQKKVVGISALAFLGVFVVAGLDFRFGWSEIPLWAVALASVLFLLGYIMFAEVMRENAYLSRIIEVQEGQKVVSDGLYGVVRHPMYAATVVMFLAMPIILGSWPSFVISLVHPIILGVRITNEEKVLREGLDGYVEYTKKVKYRLIPFIW